MGGINFLRGLGECKHSSGLTVTLWEKITPTMTAARAAVCFLCGRVIAIPAPKFQVDGTVPPENPTVN